MLIVHLRRDHTLISSYFNAKAVRAMLTFSLSRRGLMLMLSYWSMLASGLLTITNTYRYGFHTLRQIM